MEIGVISQLHGIFGPPGLLGFLSGIDELWISGDIGSVRTLALWKGVVPSVVAVGSEDDKSIGIEVPKVVLFERMGYRIMMTHKLRNMKNKEYAWMSHEVAQKAFFNRINVCVGGYTGETAVYVDEKQRNLIYINPGAVTPLSGEVSSALRFVIGEECIGGFSQFSAVCPPAYTKRDGKTVRTFAFIDGCVVDGKYAEWSSKMD